MKIWRSLLSQVGFERFKPGFETRIQYQSRAVNVYHCCVHKTGSQWIRKIFSDPIVYRYSGLKPYHYQSELPEGRDPRNINERVFREPFPPGTIVTPLYISFECFLSIPKPAQHRAFFVLRDPRDTVVSWYFSVRYSHTLMGEIPRLRKILDDLPVRDGICYAIDFLHSWGHFRALGSWIDAVRTSPNLLVVRFEDLIGSESHAAFESLLRHCDIHVPSKALRRLLAKYSFEALSGRKRGQEKKEAHYRKGVAGDWKNYLDAPLREKFDRLVGNLPEQLGYPQSVEA
jgi:hypothetical protein